MDEAKFDTVQEIFHRALDLPEGAAREEFLESALSKRPELEPEVRSLLKAHSAGEGVLDRAPAAPDVSAYWTGKRIGCYRLVREIGRGGMGIVFLAERDDDEFRQEVALKIIGQPLAGEELNLRFRNERQILANLRHPNIARLLDGGATAEGQPYLVMELIDGVAITEYCDRERLTVDRRLELFAKVCDAVQYAHRNLVIHRDLKPSNILVSPSGEVKLLDFGVAKVLEGAEGFDSAPATRAGVHLLTPEYSAPEQLQGRGVTTSSDVYALGLLLHELLCGRPAHSVGNHSLAALLKEIVEAEPVRPSQAVGPAGGPEAPEAERIARARRTHREALRRRLSGDLDLIALKCLQKKPERRYGSARELAEDLDRHVKGLPVLAAPESAGYRLRKFVARHRLSVGAGLALLLALMLGVAGIVWQGRQAAIERDRARSEAAKARRVVELMQDVFRRASPFDPEAARDLSAGDILERGAESIGAGLTEEPEVRAAIMGEIGWALYQLGRLESAERLLRQAVSIQKDALREGHPELATTLHRRALLEDHMGRYAEAEALFRQALAIREADPGPDHPDYADTLCQLAYQVSFSDPGEDAAAWFARALAVFDAAGQRSSAAALVCRHNYGSLLRRRGDYDGAERVLRETLALSAAAFDDPQREDVLTRESLALTLRQKGNLEEAEELYLEALAAKREFLSPRHAAVATTLNNLAKLYESRGDFGKAVPLYREALEIYRPELGPEHASVGVTMANLAAAHHGLGQDEVAEPLFRQALKILEAAVPEDHPYVGSALAGLGGLLNGRGRPAEAEPLLRTALEIRLASLPPSDRNVIDVVERLAESLSRQRKLDASAAVLLDALQRIETVEGDAGRRLCQSLESLLPSGGSNFEWPESCGPLPGS